MNKYTKHTPGPWIIDSEGQITDLQDRTIVPNVHGHNVPSNAFPRGSGQYESEDDGGAANARLIAAAPDLLAALAALLKDHEQTFAEAHPNSTISWNECIEVQSAKKAIAKVGGAA